MARAPHSWGTVTGTAAGSPGTRHILRAAAARRTWWRRAVRACFTALPGTDRLAGASRRTGAPAHPFEDRTGIVVGPHRHDLAVLHAKTVHDRDGPEGGVEIEGRGAPFALHD